MTKLLLDLKRSLHLGSKIACMTKTNLDAKPEQIHHAPKPLQKTKLEKTQSWLTIISTSVGLMGIAGSTFAFAVSTFYTGSIDVKPDFATPGMVVKVYTSEGHETVFHTSHISLMPGQYHLEIVSPNGRVVHQDTKVTFHHNNDIYVKLGSPPQDATISANTADAQPPTGAPESKDGLGAMLNFGASSENAAGPDSSTKQTQSGTSSYGQAEPAAKPAAEPKAAVTQNEVTDANSENGSGKKKWWQVWKRGEKNSSSESANAENAN